MAWNLLTTTTYQNGQALIGSVQTWTAVFAQQLPTVVAGDLLDVRASWEMNVLPFTQAVSCVATISCQPSPSFTIGVGNPGASGYLIDQPSGVDIAPLPGNPYCVHARSVFFVAPQTLTGWWIVAWVSAASWPAGSGNVVSIQSPGYGQLQVLIQPPPAASTPLDGAALAQLVAPHLSVRLPMTVGGV